MKLKTVVSHFSFFTLIFFLSFPTNLLGQENKEFIFFNNADFTSGKEKLPHKLKSYDKHKSYKCKKCKEAVSANISAEEKDGKIILSSNQGMKMKKVFRCRRDGVVIEYVTYDPYHCSNPSYSTYKSRYNETGSLNGAITRPVYRKDIIRVVKAEKKQWKIKKKGRIDRMINDPYGYEEDDLKKLKKEKFNFNFYKLALEYMPNFGTNQVKPNILIVHKKRIHYPCYKPETCGDDQVEVHVDFIKKDLKGEYEIVTPKDYREFTFLNYYRRGKTQIDSAVFNGIRDSVQNWNIDKIDINSFSSIEGFDTINERYHNERAQNVRTALKEFYKTEPELKVKSRENWKVFRSQLKQDSEYKSWFKLSKEQIKDKLTEEQHLVYWNDKLDEQRYSKIKITASFEEKDTLAFVLRKLNEPNELTKEQLLNFHNYLKQNHPVKFLAVVYPHEDRYEDFLYDQLDYRIRNLNPGVYRELYYLANGMYEYSKTFNNDILFLNWETFVINHGDRVGLRKSFRKPVIERIDKLIKASAYKKDAMKLKVAYYLSYIPNMNAGTQYQEMMDGLNFISDYYYYYNDSIFYNRERVTDIIDFFVQYRTDIAVMFLEKYFDEMDQFDPYLLTQYLKLTFNHPKHFNDRTYVKTLLDAKQKLTAVEWCDMFIGKCNINFQIFDDEELRQLYCETCGPSHHVGQFNK